MRTRCCGQASSLRLTNPPLPICYMEVSWEDLFPLPLDEWIQQWQVIIGLAMAFIAPFALPALMFGEVCLNSYMGQGLRTNSTYNRDMVRTTAILWEGSCIFLLVYGCVRYTTFGAVFAVLLYSLLRSIVMILVTVGWAKRNGVGDLARDGPLEPVSVYTDIEEGAFLKCLSVWMLQMLLYVLLVRWVLSKSFKDEDVSEQELFLYSCGSIVATVQRTMSNGFVRGELKTFWLSYFLSPSNYGRPHHFAKLRVVMSWLVNDVLFTAVFLLLPLVTMGSDNEMEFVKDCTAVLWLDAIPCQFSYWGGGGGGGRGCAEPFITYASLV